MNRFQCLILWITIASSFFILHTASFAQVETLTDEEYRESIRREMREELKEELREELREEEKIRHKLKELRQEIHDEFTIPCRKLLRKKCRSYPKRYECENATKTFFVKFEDELLDQLYDKSKEERLIWYLAIRRNCEQQFASEE